MGRLQTPKSLGDRSTQKNVIQRVFTRADVVALFLSFWGKHAEPRYELQNIVLLPDIQPGGWQVDYTATYQHSDHVLYCNCVILQLARGDGTPYLSLPARVDLPTGLASAAEEDAEIERARVARHAERLKECEHKQSQV